MRLRCYYESENRQQQNYPIFFRYLRCLCGNCNRDSLQNPSECYCCKELDGCEEAKNSELVLQELPDGKTIKCITDHPGFGPVCPSKWSLRMAGEKFRTKGKQRYKQTGSEER